MVVLLLFPVYREVGKQSLAFPAQKCKDAERQLDKQNRSIDFLVIGYCSLIFLNVFLRQIFAKG